MGAQRCIPCSARFISSIVGSCLLHLTFGTVYCWGNIAPYVVSYMRQQGHPVNYDEMSWAVSVTTLLQAIGMCIGGLMHLRMGIRQTANLGCSVMSAGVFLSSFTVHYGKVPFLFFYAGCFGFGVGCSYVVPMLVLMKWLPAMKGLASGIVVAGFGAGAAVFNVLQEEWVNPYKVPPNLQVDGQRFFDWHDQNVAMHMLSHVPTLLRLQAVVFACMQAVGLFMLLDPRPQEVLNTVEGDPEHAQLRTVEPHTQDLTPVMMVHTQTFWLVLGTVFCCSQVVLFMATSQKTLGLTLLPQTSDVTLTGIAGIASVLNGLGRIFWGTAADWTSFRCAMIANCIGMAVLLATLPWVCSTDLRYGLWCCGIFFCVGGLFALYPLAASTFFGSKHMGSNYGCIFLGLACSELLGSVLLEHLAGGQPLFRVCGALAVLALVAGILASQLKPPIRRPLPGGGPWETTKYGAPCTEAKSL